MEALSRGMLTHFFPVLPQPELAGVDFEALLQEAANQPDRPDNSLRTLNGSPAQNFLAVRRLISYLFRVPFLNITVRMRAFLGAGAWIPEIRHAARSLVTDKNEFVRFKP